MASLTDTIHKIFGTQTETIPITYCDDAILCTDSEVWTYMVVGGTPIDVPQESELVDHINKTIKALQTTTGRECHLYLATRAFDTERWMVNVFEKQARESAATGLIPAPAFERTVLQQATAMQGHGFKQYTRYLGVKLGTRKNLAATMAGAGGESFFKKALGMAQKAGKTKVVDPIPTVEEVRYWTAKALEIRTKLLMASALDARGATAREVYEWIWHMVTLGMNVPPPARAPKGAWGAMELSQLENELVNEKTNLLELSAVNPHYASEYGVYEKLLAEYETAENQELLDLPVVPEPELHSAVAALSVKLPDMVAMPWLLNSTTGDEAVDASIRFTVQSEKQSKEEAGKAVTSLRKELEHQHDSGVHGGTVETRYKFEQAKAHADAFNIGKGQTQIEFSCRLLIHSPSVEQTRLDTQRFITTYEEKLNTRLEWVADGQGTFYMEAFPGSKLRSDVHHEKGDIDALANAMPVATRYMGHMQDGWYLGSYGQVPLLYDFAEVARQGKAPTVLTNGSLGGGKTSTILQVVDSMILRSYTGIILDPKGDFRSLFALPGRGHFRYWDLTKDGRPGMLDPFTLVDRAVIPDDPERDTPAKVAEKWRQETKSVVVDTITRTLGKSMSSVQEEILADLIDLEMDSPAPSMRSLMERLISGDIGSFTEATGIKDETIINQRRSAAHGIGILLKNSATSSLGRLIYGERTGDTKLIYQGVPTTVVNLSGLELPQDGNPPSGPSEHVSVTIFSLLCSYAVQLLKNPRIKGSKYLVVDEVNVVKSLPAFQTMSANLNSQARSLGITPIYIDQSSKNASKDDSGFSNKIGTRIVFRSSKSERTNVANEIGWAAEDIQTLVDAMPGETDMPGRALITTQPDSKSPYPTYPGLGVVQFDRDYNPEYTDAFETNDRHDGFVRASMRSYPFDANGILHDPLSPPLQALESVGGSMSTETMGDAFTQALADAGGAVPDVAPATGPAATTPAQVPVSVTAPEPAAAEPSTSETEEAGGFF